MGNLDSSFAKIDFSPLAEENPQVVVSPNTDITRTPDQSIGVWAATLLLMALGAPLAVGIAVALSLGFLWGCFLVFIATIVCTILAKKWQGAIKSDYEGIRISNFAIKNGFTFKKGPDTKNLAGALSIGIQEANFKNQVSGSFNGFHFSFQELTPLAGLISKQREFGPFFVMSTSISPCPHEIYLRSNAHGFLGGTSLRSDEYFTSSQKMDQDGEFGKKYQLYCKGTKQQAEETLTPELVATILKFAPEFDISIVYTHLHVIAQVSRSPSMELMKNLLVATAQIREQLNKH